jgi:dimethylaniline monooxygenase (N-oxide forming)
VKLISALLRRIVLATGFTRPSVDMLPSDLFPKESDGRDYSRPNLYLQNFCTEDCSILLTNASYMDAIGTVRSRPSATGQRS